MTDKTEKCDKRFDIIIHARPETVEHKLGPAKPESQLRKVMFSYKGRVHAEGEIIGVIKRKDVDYWDYEYSEGLYFDNLKVVDYPEPRKPPTRGFAYVEVEEGGE